MAASKFGRACMCAALLVACSGPTQLVVVVDTDYDVPSEIDQIEIQVTGPSGTTRSMRAAIGGASELPHTLTVVPSGGSLGPVDIVALGRLGGVAIVSQAARVTLETGLSQTIRLFLGRECASTACADTATCRCGSCVDRAGMVGAWTGTPVGGDPCLAPMDGGAQTDGGPVGCMGDGECDDGIACTTDRCDEGDCTRAAVDATCTDGAGGTCILEFGCQYDGCSPTTCEAGPCQTARCEGDSCILESMCASGEECCDGACVSAGCDDADPCTDDACGTGGCQHTANSATCDDGTFCNGGDTCAVSACGVHAGDPCSGASVCNETMGTCVGCVTDSDCPTTIAGPWTSCSFDDECVESGTHDRTVTSYACVSSVCAPSPTIESEDCGTRMTSGISCGITTFGGWGSCGGFSDPCDLMGTRTRPQTDLFCDAGACTPRMGTDMGTCSRSTDGMTCGETEAEGWGVCGGFSSVCAERGTQTRTLTEFMCGGGSCLTSMRDETGDCVRSTEDDDCLDPGDCEHGSCSAGVCNSRPCGAGQMCCATARCVPNGSPCPI